MRDGFHETERAFLIQSLGVAINRAALLANFGLESLTLLVAYNLHAVLAQKNQMRILSVSVSLHAPNI